MITPPPNPNDTQARAAMMQHNAQIKPVEQHHGEVIIAEWHLETDRTFTIDEAKRWFKVARLLMIAAHDAPGGNDERIG